MHTKLVRSRKSAFNVQSGRCFYCSFPMWENAPESFAQSNKISLSQARRLKCTAEHLEARKDGGTDVRENIVAACLWCNQHRHRIKQTPNPSAYQRHVKSRLSKGGWHAFQCATRNSN